MSNYINNWKDIYYFYFAIFQNFFLFFRQTQERMKKNSEILGNKNNKCLFSYLHIYIYKMYIYMCKSKLLRTRKLNFVFKHGRVLMSFQVFKSYIGTFLK